MVAMTTVAVTGGTGFVGKHVVRDLLGAGYKVRLLARGRAEARQSFSDSRVTIVEGDVLDASRVDEVLVGAQACINLVGIIREDRSKGQTFEKLHARAPRLLLERCGALGVRRFVHMSALGVRDTGVSEYQRTKWAGELAVRRSGLDWTIFRPSMIHGPEGEFIRMAKAMTSGHQAPYLFIPYFVREVEDKRVPLGSVEHQDPMIQPVDVRDVARAFVLSLPNDAAVGEVYSLAGSETLSWPEMLRHIRDHVPGANRDLEPHGVPSGVAALAAKGAGLLGMGKLLPFDEGMAKMGGEDSTAEREKVRTDLGLETRAFRPAFTEYAPSV